MDTSIFTDKAKKPGDAELAAALGRTYNLWLEIENMVLANMPSAKKEWYFFSAKYGWGFRVKDTKRAIIYLGPRKKLFIVTMVFGQKAYDKILASPVDTFIKEELKASKVYPEGRVIRTPVKTKPILKDIKQLIDIKMAK
ncbi:MAG: DUF3788 family protein [Chitinophagaceae bacterium]|nr:DUF3788 family protein [Chitinophagaceae bacterium]MBK8952354.1 DUF3788 family protein [Chitinophagaceae bacterium]